VNRIEHIPFKDIRAQVILAYVLRSSYRDGIVCCSCGNAVAALRSIFDDVKWIGRDGYWYTPAEIHGIYPRCFDATPGHLPAPLMVELAKEYRRLLGVYAGEWIVPTGSGETILCLQIAYPQVRWIAEYDDSKSGTRFEPKAPLNQWVAGLFTVIRK
jgi:hypothetical protein